MSYDNKHHKEVPVTVANMATAPVTRVTRGKKGQRGVLSDIVFSCVTAPGGAPGPRVQVGVAGDLTRFADWDLAATGVQAGSSASASATAGALKRPAPDYVPPTIPEDTDVVITVTQATGAGAAGGGDIQVHIGWY